jgi:hypothetical protein
MAAAKKVASQRASIVRGFGLNIRPTKPVVVSGLCASPK